MRRTTTLALLALLNALPASAIAQGGDTALLHCATNLASGSGNFFLYHRISQKAFKVAAGDVLRYELYIAAGCPQSRGGIDILFEGGRTLRDSGAVDREGRRAHGDADLPGARGHWITREIELGHLVDAVSMGWHIHAEGDAPGSYVQLVDNVEVRNGERTRLVVYRDGPPDLDRVQQRSGYSRYTLLAAVPRREQYSVEEIDGHIGAVRHRAELERLAEAYRQELELFAETARRAGRADVLAHLSEARAVAGPEEYLDRTIADFEAELHRGRRLLLHDHAHPHTRAYTGHLVGHAHIDFQWLWEWPETVEECRKTFGQAVRFMEEFPGFTFSQSSAALYLATEQNFPELFERIRHHVAEGRWELVGGRWCEGDTNMVSGEAHARQLLEGQRYFREKFGRIATVGWEPDTFGHAWTLPQILRLGGIDCYYFCRAGKGKPLFHWEGPDGSRVLAFEESATGSWYNASVGWNFMREMLDFELVTGMRDLLWVYGVGNHGGGPTREDILQAVAWQKNATLPRVEFSTARRFFDVLGERNLSKVPVVRAELNTIFTGCYTTHGDMKRWNRRAEHLLVALETVAAMASRSGFEYPRKLLRSAWRDVLWNHHHDTLPGTSIHPSYGLSRAMYERLFEQGERALSAALAHLGKQVRGAAPGSWLVVNPLGWERTGWCEVVVPDGGDYTVVDAAGRPLPSQIVDEGPLQRLVFRAERIPGFGHDGVRVLGGAPPPEVVSPQGMARVEADGLVLATERLRLELDPQTGYVRSLRDLAAGRELVPAGELLGRFEVLLEKPNPMSAWQIGEIARVEHPDRFEHLEVIERGPWQVAVRLERKWRGSTIRQRIALRSGSSLVDFSLEVDWKERGGADRECPMLRIAFPLALDAPAARFEIPFGAIERPRDGGEVPALRWAALSSAEYTAGLLNDCRHGYRADERGLSLSLVRSSYYPDPEPDQYLHAIGVALFLAPRTAGSELALQRAAHEFNQPLRLAVIPPSFEDAPAAPRRAFVRLAGAVLPTALKRAEDGDALVLRVYEALGREAEVEIEADFELGRVSEVDLIEDILRPATMRAGKVAERLRPWEIRSFRLEPKEK